MATTSDGGSLWLGLPGAVHVSGLGFDSLSDFTESVLHAVVLGLREVGTDITL